VSLPLQSRRKTLRGKRRGAEEENCGSRSASSGLSETCEGALARNQVNLGESYVTVRVRQAASDSSQGGLSSTRRLFRQPPAPLCRGSRLTQLSRPSPLNRFRAGERGMG
jgi:hypothetical protein